MDLDDSWDVVISNPPYISPRDYAPGGKTEASVRKYEPRLALVPPISSTVHDGDIFYPTLTRLFRGVGAHLLVMEVGDSEQAARAYSTVAHNLESQDILAGDDTHLFECWKDDGSMRTLLEMADVAAPALQQPPTTEEQQVSDRAVLVWSGPLAQWRQSGMGAKGPS